MKKIGVSLIMGSVVIFIFLALSGCASTGGHQNESIYGSQQAKQPQKMRVVVVVEEQKPVMTLGGKEVSPEVSAVLKTSRLPAVPTDSIDRARLKGQQDLEATAQRQREVAAYCEGSKGLNCQQSQQRSGWRPPNPAERALGLLVGGGMIAASSSNLYGFNLGGSGVNASVPGPAVWLVGPLSRWMFGSR